MLAFGVAIALVDPTRLTPRPLVAGAVLVGANADGESWMAPSRLAIPLESGASWTVNMRSLSKIEAVAGEWTFDVRPVATGRSAWIPARYIGEIELTPPSPAATMQVVPAAAPLDLLVASLHKPTGVAVHHWTGLAAGCEGLCEFAVFVNVTADGRFVGTAPIPPGIQIRSVSLNGASPSVYWLALGPGIHARESVAEAIAVSRSFSEWWPDSEPIHSWLRRDIRQVPSAPSGVKFESGESAGLLIALAGNPIPKASGAITTVGYLAISGVGPGDEPWELILAGVGVFGGPTSLR